MLHTTPVVCCILLVIPFMGCAAFDEPHMVLEGFL
jgi:hypothetical protein